jgi:predicted DNA-binding transcriptional regulator AlpA
MFMTSKELQAWLGLSRWAVDRRDAEGKMPRPVPLPGPQRRWLRQEILDWVEAGRPSRSDWEARHGGRFLRDRAVRAIMPAGGQRGPEAGPGSVDRGDLAQLLRVSLRTINSMNKSGKIPRPVPGPGHPRWNFRGVLDWIGRDCPAHEDGEVGPGGRAAGSPNPDVPATIAPRPGSAGGAPPFPVEAFPGPLRTFAAEAATSIGCPVDLVALPMLAAAATAIGTSRVIEAKPGWREGPRLYLAAVAPPGSGKTPAEEAAFGPIRRLEATGLDLDQADVSGREPAPPRRLVASDATVEGLIPLLRDHPRGLILLIDELSGWRASFDRYRGGRGNDRQFFLSCFSGQPLTVDRKSAGPVAVPDPFLTVFGTIQPDLLPRLADKGGRADGFLDRILFGFPEPVAGRRWSEQGLSGPAADAWHRVIGRLATMGMDPGPEGGPARPRVLGFAPEAKRAWVAWYDAHAAESEGSRLGESLEGAWKKLEIYALRLVLILQLLRSASGEAGDAEVDIESVRRAGSLMDYFKAHARRVHARLAERPDDRRVDQVRRWIEAHGGEVTARELQRKNVGGIRKASEARTQLAELVDRGLGRIERRKAANGQPVEWFVLDRSHP